MKPINVEVTMGHDIGISGSYYKPTEKEVLEDYLKAVTLLTISNDNIILQKEVAELQQKSKDNEYIIRGKLQVEIIRSSNFNWKLTHCYS
ncbi:MAG: hypothetical protein WA220_12615 [Candidatus Nitrosopolaris sp.]